MPGSKKFRFAIGEMNGFRSSVWSVGWGPEDVYVSPRPLYEHMKLSLHNESYCQWAITGPRYNYLVGHDLPRREKRQIHSWYRASAGDHGTVHVASILLPGSSLTPFGAIKPRRAKKRRESIYVFPTPPRGSMIEVGIFSHRERAESLTFGPSTLPITHFDLENGEKITLVPGKRNDSRWPGAARRTTSAAPWRCSRHHREG